MALPGIALVQWHREFASSPTEIDANALCVPDMSSSERPLRRDRSKARSRFLIRAMRPLTRCRSTRASKPRNRELRPLKALPSGRDGGLHKAHRQRASLDPAKILLADDFSQYGRGLVQFHSAPRQPPKIIGCQKDP